MKQYFDVYRKSNYINVHEVYLVSYSPFYPIVFCIHSLNKLSKYMKHPRIRIEYSETPMDSAQIMNHVTHYNSTHYYLYLNSNQFILRVR